jgi:hypothetical protein
MRGGGLVLVKAFAKHLAAAIIVSSIILVSQAFCAQQSQSPAYPVDVQTDALRVEKVDGYDLVTLPGCDLTSKVGEPQLPVKYVTVALPQGMQAVGVDVTYSGARELYQNFYIKPGERPIPISYSGRLPAQTLVPDRAVYSSGSAYPGELAVLLGNGSLSGHPLADVAVYPVQYVPRTGRLTVYEDIEITLVLEPDPDPAVINHRSEQAERIFSDAVRKLVINPDEVADTVANWSSPAPLADDVEYLIITKSDFVSAFQRLADWKTKKGVPTQVVTTDWVYANYSGESNGDYADRIRDCIKDYWQNRGTVYVLLAGDTSKVTYRNAYVMASDNGNAIPADLYFSDLDGNWNADGDGYFGEYPADGIDMYADVYVGRAPVDYTSEATRFVNKVLQYEGEASEPDLPADYQQDMLFMGSELDSMTDCAILKNKIDTESVPAQFDIEKLYESSGNLSVSSAVAAMNSGKNIINNASHGDNTMIQVGAEWLYPSHLSGLTNDPRFTVVLFATSCYACNFSYGDCIAESFVLAANGGGNFIGNSRYGWYYQGNPSSGLSARFDRYFFMALLRSTYDYYHLGEAFGESRNFGVGVAKGDDHERYCLYELNLLGDPETPVYKYNPSQLVSSHPATLPIGSSEFTVNVKAGGSNVNAATVCLWKGSEVYLVGETDASGNVTFYPSPATTGTMYVTASKFDYKPDQSEASVEESEYQWTEAPNPQPYGDGALFGAPQNGFPGWVWFSIPLTPDDGDPQVLLGFNCKGSLWYWDKYSKSSQVYNPPFIEFDLAPGDSYLARLTSAVDNPGYMGLDPGSGFSFLLGKQGWTWIGLPGPNPLGYPDFMDDVTVQYPVGGANRTAAQDRASGSPWVNWGWAFLDTYLQSPKTFTPYSAFGNNTAYPWIGYRAYVNVGTASSESGTDQVKLRWP